MTLDISITGAVNHVLMSNGTVTDLGANHWSAFPSSFASCSHFLVIEAADRIEQHTGSTVLPDGQPVSIEVAQRAGDGLNLPTLRPPLPGTWPRTGTGSGRTCTATAMSRC